MTLTKKNNENLKAYHDFPAEDLRIFPYKIYKHNIFIKSYA